MQGKNETSHLVLAFAFGSPKCRQTEKSHLEADATSHRKANVKSAAATIKAGRSSIRHFAYKRQNAKVRAALKEKMSHGMNVNKWEE